MTDTTGANLPSSTTLGPEPPIFFFKPDEPLGEFCQWYPAKFTASKADICAEQFMVYCKAGRFRDAETQRLVLATKDPKEQKRLARLTRGFEASSWDEIKSEVVVTGNMGKFGQNRRLRSLLLSTGDRVLAEAASQDRVWGIGFTAREAMALQKPELWGENRLGKVLMEVRRRLREEEQ
ncbi:unnamed protein product [Clonostachys rhizophaga]|uniref:NADAR domain-containing protein n=1 Tax=Clonostachys rhizophaga TaxID=160324 RepID=A0A9N9V0Y8_9HYPO|nr:unnamed protein product [Clonostachys rhizophaga]